MREDVLKQFEALAVQFDASAAEYQYGDQDQRAFVDTYLSCAGEVRDIIAKLRGSEVL